MEIDPWPWLTSLLIPVIIAFIYDRITKKIPSRLAADQAPKSGLGLVPAASYPQPARSRGIDIIFVHGLGSNPDTTWRARRSDATSNATEQPVPEHGSFITWVSDFLPNDLQSTKTDTRLFFYNFDSYWKRDAVHARLSTLGADMLEHIKDNIRRSENDLSRDIIFVGYSYGGLVIKKALILAREDTTFAHLADHTKAVLFLGTPHRGSSLTTGGWLTAQALLPLGSNPSILGEVEYDSVPLLDLHKSFTASLRDDALVFNFFEQRPTTILQVWFVQWREFCVREQSATYPGRKVRNIGLPVDHSGLNKFGSDKDVGYTIILSKLREVISSSDRSTKRHYVVPLETVSSYTGRDDLLSELSQKLQIRHENAAVPHAVAVQGLGGSGKSQLVLKFAEEHKDRYDPILWIDATDEEAMRSSFEKCATELGLVYDRNAGQRSRLGDSEAIQGVLRWLRDRTDADEEWLVIVDNADDLSLGVKWVIPKGNRSNVIITSQDKLSSQLVERGCEEVKVGIMSSTEGRALLLHYLSYDEVTAPKAIQQQCDEVAEKLGYLPLAIDLAGAYIGNDPAPERALAQYSTDFGRHHDELLQMDHFRGLRPSEKTVWTTWNTTLERIRQKDGPLPDILLTLLAHFKGNIIQDEVFRLASLGMVCVDYHFNKVEDDLSANKEDLAKKEDDSSTQVCERLPPDLRQFLELRHGEWDSFVYRQSRDTLLRYHLLQRVEGQWAGVTMHNLVQWRAIKQSENIHWQWYYTLFMLAACWQLNQEDGRPEFRRHLIMHLPHVDIGKTDGDELEMLKCSIANELSLCHSQEGRWDEAEKLRSQVSEIRTRVLGEEHPDTLTSMANLATTYRDKGYWDKAEKLDSQVLEIQIRVLGEEHPHTLTSMANLATTYRDKGYWDKAEKLERQVLEMRTRVLGEEHPDTLNSMANLATTYWDQGYWDKAEKLERQVLGISIRVLGEEHPDTLNSMANLATTYWDQGYLDKAEKLDRQVLGIRIRVLGEEHPDTLRSMADLASTYWNQGYLDKAEQLHRRVFVKQTRILGEEHPRTLITKGSLASTFWRQGRFDEAEKLETQVLEARKTRLGPDHPDTLISMSNLAVTLEAQGRLAEALSMMESCVDAQRRVLGLDHPTTLKSEKTLKEWTESEALRSRSRLFSEDSD